MNKVQSRKYLKQRAVGWNHDYIKSLVNKQVEVVVYEHPNYFILEGELRIMVDIHDNLFATGLLKQDEDGKDYVQGFFLDSVKSIKEKIV